MATIALWLFLLSIAQSMSLAATGEFQLHCPQPSVAAETGGTVTLQCYTDPRMDVSKARVEWLDNDKHEVHLYRKEEDDLAEQEKKYKGRTSLFIDVLSTGSCSLNLSNVQGSDSGTYRCSVKIGKEESTCTINLSVKSPGENNASPASNSAVGQPEPTESPDTLNGSIAVGFIALVALVAFVCLVGLVALVAFVALVALVAILFGIPKSRRFILEKLKYKKNEEQRDNRNVPEEIPLRDQAPDVPADANV